jgi:uncharacterized damage-inducible protein DinB
MIPPPDSDEYADFHRGYIAAVAGESDALAVLERQQHVIDGLRRLTAEQASHRYAEGKWSVRDIIGHLSDAERVFAYRLLCIARGETGALPGFEEQVYAANSNASTRELSDLVDELRLVRQSTLALVRSLPPAVLTSRGTVNKWTLSVRAMVFIIAGHFQHHVNVLRDRYGIQG